MKKIDYIEKLKVKLKCFFGNHYWQCIGEGCSEIDDDGFIIDNHKHFLSCAYCKSTAEVKNIDDIKLNGSLRK